MTPKPSTAAGSHTPEEKPKALTVGTLPATDTKRIRCTKALNDGEKHEEHIWYSLADPHHKDPFKCSGIPVTTVVSSTVPVNKTYLGGTSRGKAITREDWDAKLGVKEARKMAFYLHAGQKDKSDEPYEKHLEAVRQGVVVLGGDEEEQIAALFHDAVEDWHCTYEHLRSWNVTDRTIGMIKAVSKTANEEQNAYLARIIKEGPGAMRVKVADLLHNLRHDRMETVKKKKGEYTYERLLKKYRPALARLLMELNLVVDEAGQKKLATKPQGTGGGYYTNTDGTQSFEVTSLIVGDWPKVWPAPIVRKLGSAGDKKEAFLLANGEVRAEDLYYSATGTTKRKLSAYTYDSWKSGTGNMGGSKTVRDDFRFLVDEAKDYKKSTGVSTVNLSDLGDVLPDEDWDDDSEQTWEGKPVSDETQKGLWDMTDAEFDEWVKSSD